MSKLEKVLDKDLKKREPTFIKNISETVDQNNSITINEMNDHIFTTFDMSTESIKDDFQEILSKIIDNAKQHAQTLIGRKPGKLKTAGILEDSINSAFERIDGIPEEIASKLKQEWINSGGKSDIVPLLIKKTIEEASEIGYNPKEINKALRELWKKQQSTYRSIMRTVTINAYAKTQLQEWDDEGIEDVERHCIDDSRTCEICRALCSPGRNIYNIKSLLILDDPITYFSHPQCRDFFTPTVNWDNLDEFLFFEPIGDVEVDNAEIKNVPLGYQEEIRELDRRITLDGQFEFVPDVSQTHEWFEDKRQEYMNQGYNEIEATSMAQMDQTKAKGNVLTFEGRDATIISGQMIDASSFANALLVHQATEVWTMADKDFWNSHYQDLLLGDVPIINMTAEESAKNLFIETYIMFHTNPYRLLTLDSFGYDDIAQLTGNDFFADGAVR